MSASWHGDRQHPRGLTPRGWTILAALLLIWLFGAWATRHVDSDTGTPTGSPTVTTGKTSTVGDTPSRVAAGTPTPLPAATRASRNHRRRPLLNWHALAQCESSNDPKAVSSSGRYRGLYQMDRDFWRTYGGLRYASRPDLATRAEQTAVAARGYAARGRSPWPTCGARL